MKIVWTNKNAMEVSLIFAISCFIYFSYKHFAGSAEADEGGQRIEIRPLITEIKKQLIELDRERVNNGELAIFALDSFELELSFAVKSASAESSGGDFELITIEQNESSTQETAQKLKLRWTAVESETVTTEGEPLEGF